MAILMTYQERTRKNLIKNPYPKLNKKIVDNISNFSLANFAESGQILSERQKKNKAIDQFITNICKTISVDEIFNVEDVEEKVTLVDMAVKGKRDKYGQFMMARPRSDMKSLVLNEKKHAHIEKVKSEIEKKRALLNKISLMVNLRLTSGPLFIHAVLEVIKLNKHILAL